MAVQDEVFGVSARATIPLLSSMHTTWQQSSYAVDNDGIVGMYGRRSIPIFRLGWSALQEKNEMVRTQSIFYFKRNRQTDCNPAWEYIFLDSYLHVL